MKLGTCAGGIADELISRPAIAAVAERQVDARVIAVGRRRRALVAVALVQRLVLSKTSRHWRAHSFVSRGNRFFAAINSR